MNVEFVAAGPGGAVDLRPARVAGGPPGAQAWVELDVASPQAVGDAVAELESAGCTVLRGAHEEPWSQTTARVLSPESLLVGIAHTPWMHT